MRVSAVIVSNMDRLIGEVTDSIIRHVDELIVIRGEGGVWQRYEAIARAKCDVIYTQDDDAIVDVPTVLAAYEPGKVCCNMPLEHRMDYPDRIALVGWGCVFKRDDWHVEAWKSGYVTGSEPFCAYRNVGYPIDDVFRRECDRVFTGLSPLKLIDVPVRHLPHAHGPDRMGREKRHGDDLREIRRRIYAIRAAK